MDEQRILILGGTGVMGSYLVPELLRRGYRVDAVCRHSMKSNDARLKYIPADCMHLRILQAILQTRYEAIIDFMTYQTWQFAERFELFCKSTDHYLFLSSYRAYSDLEIPTKETSPRLLDVVEDMEFLETDDYSLAKARQENILRSSCFDNWTILRPSIIYSNQRLQLTTLEKPQFLRRAQERKPVYVSQEALNADATMTWAGDVAKMIAGLTLNKRAFKESYSIATAEHHKWQEIADFYKELIGLNCVPVSTETYLGFFGNSLTAKFQLKYDRCQRRIMDNSKVLEHAGLKQEDLMPLRDGLAMEIAKLPTQQAWSDTDVYLAMEAYMNANRKSMS